MSTHDYKTQQNESQAFATVFFLKQDFGNLAPKFIYNTPGAIAQIKLQRATNNSQCVQEEMENNSMQQGTNIEENPIQGKSDSIQDKTNDTGLPDNLKSGLEQLSGYAMDDVNVHYNTSQPSQLNSKIDTQDAPEHEKHLPQEAWHVVHPPKVKKNTNDSKGLKKEIFPKPDLKTSANSAKNARRRE